MVPKPFRSLRNQQITNPKNTRHSTRDFDPELLGAPRRTGQQVFHESRT